MNALLTAVLLAATVVAGEAPLPSREPPEIVGEWVQGGTITGRTEPGAQVWLDGRALRVTDGRFVFGLSREAPKGASLRIRYPDGSEKTIEAAVRQREYDVQRITGLPKAMVTPPPEALKQIARDNQRVAAARAADTARTDFAAPFAWPVVGRISGIYGSQRILNGEARQPHYGIDIAAPQGTPVRAPAAGIVRLARSDLYYTGGTIILDHGHGLSTTYLHLSKLGVEVGQAVAQGDVIGEVGATGRATGPHLCFRLNWFETRLDPQLLIGPMPEAAADPGS